MNIKNIFVIFLFVFLGFSCDSRSERYPTTTRVYVSFFDNNIFLKDDKLRERFKFSITQNLEQKYDISIECPSTHWHRGQAVVKIMNWGTLKNRSEDEIEKDTEKLIKDLDSIGFGVEDLLEKYKPVEIYPLRKYIDERTLPDTSYIVIKLEKQ